jgi:hypothetical protein
LSELIYVTIKASSFYDTSLSFLFLTNKAEKCLRVKKTTGRRKKMIHLSSSGTTRITICNVFTCECVPISIYVMKLGTYFLEVKYVERKIVENQIVDFKM